MIEVKTFRCGPKDRNWASDIYVNGTRVYCGRGFERLCDSKKDAQSFQTNLSYRANAVRLETDSIRNLVNNTFGAS